LNHPPIHLPHRYKHANHPRAGRIVHLCCIFFRESKTSVKELFGSLYSNTFVARCFSAKRRATCMAQVDLPEPASPSITKYRSSAEKRKSNSFKTRSYCKRFSVDLFEDYFPARSIAFEKTTRSLGFVLAMNSLLKMGSRYWKNAPQRLNISL
jgi:hypothetical protein